jgi:hypothetical protein
LKELEQENVRLKKIVANLSIDNYEDFFHSIFLSVSPCVSVSRDSSLLSRWRLRK